MKPYRVTFTEDAIADLVSSLQWGIEVWGEDAALKWYSDIRGSIQDLLGEFPLSQPLAPDANEYEVEVRQMISGRYRVLFTVDRKTVTILHIRGPYTG